MPDNSTLILLPCIDDIFCIQVDHFFEADGVNVDGLVFGVVRALTQIYQGCNQKKVTTPIFMELGTCMQPTKPKLKYD